MTATVRTPMSLAEFLDYDNGTDQRYELIDGVPVEMATECDINIQIASFLLVYFATLGVPPYLLSLKTAIAIPSRLAKARCPDLMVKTEALDAVMVNTAHSMVMPEMPPPQLVIEIVSPGAPGSENYTRDYAEKLQEYGARGIPEYWIVDPARETVRVLALDSGEYREVGTYRGSDRLTSPSFTALALTAAEVLRAGR